MTKPAGSKRSAKLQKNTPSTDEQSTIPDSQSPSMQVHSPFNAESTHYDQQPAYTMSADDLHHHSANISSFTSAPSISSEINSENINCTTTTTSQQPTPQAPTQTAPMEQNLVVVEPQIDWASIPPITDPAILEKINKLWAVTDYELFKPPEMTEEQLQSYRQANEDWVDYSKFIDVPMF